jgi:hypothetical protein
MAAEDERQQLEERARSHYDRIAAVMKSLEPAWPTALPEFEWTRSRKPIIKVDEASYLLQDETVAPENDVVVEVCPGRMRTVGSGGIVLAEKAISDPSQAGLN